MNGISDNLNQIEVLYAPHFADGIMSHKRMSITLRWHVVDLYHSREMIFGLTLNGVHSQPDYFPKYTLNLCELEALFVLTALLQTFAHQYPISLWEIKSLKLLLVQPT